MDSTAVKKASWFVTLINTYNTKAKELELEEDATAELRELFIDKCREQYAVGNKAGIAWLKRVQAEEAAKAQSAHENAS